MPRALTAAGTPRAADRRPRILEAAMHLFSALPYADVHMDAVAAAAGVAKPTLYRYFPTKEALFIEGLAWELAALRREIGADREASSLPSAPERLRRAVSVALDRVGRLRPVLHAVEGEGSLGDQSRRVLRAGFGALKAEIGMILHDGARAGDLAPVDVDLAVHLILGGVRMAASTERSRPVDPVALADLLLDGLRPVARTGAARASQASPAKQASPANEPSGSCRAELGAVA